jgi:hypothetical protein
VSGKRRGRSSRDRKRSEELQAQVAAEAERVRRRTGGARQSSKAGAGFPVRTGAHKTSPLTKSPADVRISGGNGGQDA